jgi:ribosome biogenesis GTPase
LVANVDQAIIVMASYKPDFNPRRLDRYLVATHNGNITPVVCINKVDLVPAAKVSPEMEPYVANGIQVIYTSAEDGTGLDQLRAILRGKVSAMVGSSGVGKSSLINAIDPELSLRTQEIRNRFYKGQHTTTAAELLRLDIGGFVVDTPGMREFGLWQRKQAQVVESFDEFGDYASQCKFRNCTHSHEPGCAVKVAVANGEIDESRYESYLKLARLRRA